MVSRVLSRATLSLCAVGFVLFVWHHSAASHKTAPSKSLVARSEQRFFTLPPAGVTWSPGAFVCAIDAADASHFPMFLNAAISLDPLCDYLMAVAMNPDVIPLLKRYRVPYVYSRKLIALDKKASAKRLDYLRAPMVMKGRLVLEMLEANYSVLVTDSDTFHLRSMSNHLLELRSRGKLVDVATSSFKTSHIDEGMMDWHAPLVVGSPERWILNNGVAAYFASDASRRFARLLWESDRLKDGWLQTNFLALLRQDEPYFVPVEHEFMGFHAKLNLTVLMVPAVTSPNFLDCLGHVIWGLRGTCFHFHALGGGNYKFSGAMKESKQHSVARSSYIRSQGFWVLTDGWGRLQPRFSFREFLSRADSRKLKPVKRRA